MHRPTNKHTHTHTHTQTVSALNEWFGMRSDCTCPEHTATFECTAVGGVATLWQGSALDCENNEIILVHDSRFENRTVVCNSRALVGQGLSCLLYTSPSPRDATLSRMPSSA